MKIYTGTGDSGTTGILGGERVTKDHPRIEAYGTVDELNATIGLVLALDSVPESGAGVVDSLQRIQSELFVVGADLATPMESRVAVPRVDQPMIGRLESDIDQTEENLEELKTFILPGGSPAAASLHVARTVCRRAERRVVHLAEIENINELTVIYLNRLADLLFVFARFVNRGSGCPDVIWQPEKGSEPT